MCEISFDFIQSNQTSPANARSIELKFKTGAKLIFPNCVKLWYSIMDVQLQNPSLHVVNSVQFISSMADNLIPDPIL